VTTRIRREKHRSLWQRAGVRIGLLVLVAFGALLVQAWRLGGPVPVRPVAVALPATTVGSVAPASNTSAASAASGIGG